MTWGASVSTQTVVLNSIGMTLSICSNDQNLLDFVHKNNLFEYPTNIPSANLQSYQDYTDGYSLKVTATLIMHEDTTKENSNFGFCLFNELYADCVVLATDENKDITVASYVVMDGVDSAFFKTLLQATQGTRMINVLSFADSDLAWKNGAEDDYTAQVGVFRDWHVTYEEGYDFTVTAHRFLPRVETQTGSDLREYSGLNVTGMLFFAQTSGNVYYANQTSILLGAQSLTSAFLGLLLTSLL